MEHVIAMTDMSIRSDPFMKMAEANKTYGFTIAVKELRETVPNIFRYASAYKRKKGLKSKGLWEMFLEDPFGEENKDEVPKDDKLPEEVDGEKNPDVDPEAMEGERYNMCHFWSNFEIARLDFFRSREYEDFFEMMDRSGGFWMERVCVLMTCVIVSFPNGVYSGAMHQFTLSPPGLSWPRATFIISETSDIGTLLFNTVPQTRLLDNWRAFRTWK
jgi:hypothetical protein